jgi:hypothetical protein
MDTCFVLMPFAPEFKNQWELAFIPAIESVNLRPFRGDEEALGTNMIIKDITKSIYDARIIVADLTGRNPNVMYELGLADLQLNFHPATVRASAVDAPCGAV